MRKLFKSLALLLAVCLLCTACIYAEIIPLESVESSEEASSEAPSAVSPILGGIWTDEDALNAAALMMKHPTGGVVDVSKADYSYSELAADLEFLAKIYPRYFAYASIGKSAAGREIYAGVLGDPNAPRQVVVTAAIHAREYMTAQLVMKQLEFYLANYTVGSYGGISYSTLFSDCCFYILPMVNPDGVMLAQEGIGSLPFSMQLKLMEIMEREGETNVEDYFSTWKANANGVDLNRNYDALWEEYNKTNQPSSSQYKGPAPESEPETAAVVSLFRSLSNVVCSLCIHSQGEVIYWNCGQSGSAAEATRAYAESVSDLNGYYVVPSQNNDASLSDWCELRLGVVSVTVETGNVACPLPIEQFPSIFLDNFLLWGMTALYFRPAIS